jgi:two-component system, sensor histidine kinase
VDLVLAPPAIPADPSPPRATAIRHVVVEGREPGERSDAAASRGAERRALRRRMSDAATVAARNQLPYVAVALIALLPAAWCLFKGAGLGPALMWAATVSTVAATMLWLPRARRHAVRHRHIVVLACGAAICVVVAPWFGAAEWRTLLVVLAIAVGVSGSGALAPLPIPASALAATPMLAAAAPLLLGGPWWWAMAGAAGSAAAVATAWQRGRWWRQSIRTLISQQERLQQLTRERDLAQRSDHEKSRFLAIASHDLRQPVHALGLFAATLQRRLKHSPDAPLARDLMRAVDGLERSFNALLDISKLDASGLEPRVVTFSLRDMFRRLHMQYAGQAELAGLGLRFSPGGKSVNSDPQLLERMVSNLIQNAIKYTARGGIVVVARSTRSGINVEVWDTGVGIPADKVPRIFDEFYQAGRAERDRSVGLGMGLAIVKRLATLLGHRLEVVSALGRGTMFRIGVPIGGLPGIPEDIAPADTQPMTPSAQMVLVVDDEEPIRLGLRLLLQEWGYEATTAASAIQAEYAVSALEGRVDLVLSDLHLGDGPNGREVIARVRRLCGREVPAILITGDTARDEIERMGTGGDPVLFKPVQPRVLFDAVRAALN